MCRNGSLLSYHPRYGRLPPDSWTESRGIVIIISLVVLTDDLLQSSTMGAAKWCWGQVRLSAMVPVQLTGGDGGWFRREFLTVYASAASQSLVDATRAWRNNPLTAAEGF
ncbi:hypothetical protein Bbelb_067080 [Branchiostoma belcheri]|nr:hypothetical protein Bbelb_067080 [Branchiostoma belcheri]